VTRVLRDGVLAGVGVAVVGSGFADAVRERVGALGARAEGPVDTLVVDVSESAVPRAALDGAWDAVQPVATEMIAAGGGQVVLLAPRPGDAAVEGARAGLETMARTLSIEWARYGVRPVAILPGAATSPAEVAELVAYLASAAGGYYAGCALTLGSAA
jgi:hypothetical protein